MRKKKFRALSRFFSRIFALNSPSKKLSQKAGKFWQHSFNFGFKMLELRTVDFSWVIYVTDYFILRDYLMIKKSVLYRTTKD